MSKSRESTDMRFIVIGAVVVAVVLFLFYVRSINLLNF